MRRIPAPRERPEAVQWPAHFDSTAQEWDSSYEERTLQAHRKRARNGMALQLIGDGPGLLLEVGVGSGRLLSELDTRGWAVSGIDAAPRMIELARARMPLSAGRLAVARAEALPFPTDAFDMAVSLGVIAYTDIEKSLGEIARVLRPGGRAVLGIGNRRATLYRWRRDVVAPIADRVRRLVPFGSLFHWARVRHVSFDETRRLLTAVGLSIERVEDVVSYVLPDPLDRLAPGLAYRAAVAAERSPRLRRLFGTQLLFVCRKR